MKSILRSIVGSPKQSHYDPVLNLLFDLSYITPQIIVCSGPVNNYFQSFYRHPVEDFVKFLTANHGSHWHIWNFRGEEPGYDNDDVMSKVSYYPLPDHQPPTIQMIKEGVKEIDEFLSISNANVAVLHCKSGKGRSGTFFCSYLLYRKILLQKDINPHLAIEIYTKRRMRRAAGDGVSILSQRRYLDYWFEYLQMEDELKELFDKFSRDESIFDLKKSCITMIKVNDLKMSYSSDLDLIFESYIEHQNFPNGVEIREVYRINSSDIRKQTNDKIIIVPGEQINLAEVKDMRISINQWCYSWFNIFLETLHSNPANLFAIDSLVDNTQFIKGKYTLNWEDLDGFKGTHQRGRKLFGSLDIFWRLYY